MGNKIINLDGSVNMLYPCLSVIGAQTLCYTFCQFKKDNSYIDVFWGITFITPILGLMLKRYIDDGPEPDMRAMIVLGLVTAWALRLSIHIGVRHRGEDFRYANWRKEWTDQGGYWGFLWRSFVIIFML